MRADDTTKGRLWLGGLGLGGVLLAGTGLWMAFAGEFVVERFLSTGVGTRVVLIILVVNLALAALRALVNWRRTSQGRPIVDLAPFIYPIVVFQLITLVALILLGLGFIGLYLVGAALAPTLLLALINVLVGAVLLALAGRAVCEVMVVTRLVVAVR